MRTFLHLFFVIFFASFACSVFGDTSETDLALNSPLMMLKFDPARQQADARVESSDYGGRNRRFLEDPNNNPSDSKQRSDLTATGGIQEKRTSTLTESSEVPTVNQNTLLDRFMAVIGDPLNVLFGPNAQDVKERQRASLNTAFNEELKRNQQFSKSQIPDLLIKVKNNFSESWINESDVIDCLLELAQQKGGSDCVHMFVFKIFDESLQSLQQSNTALSSSTAAPAVMEKSEQEQAHQLIEAAKNSPLFSKILQPKRLKWSLAWASSRNYPDAVLKRVKVLANTDETSFGTPQQEKNQYLILYKARGIEALENEFMRLLEDRISELHEAALNTPDEVADLLMTVRLKFCPTGRVGTINIDSQILSLAKTQGDSVRDAFYYKIFDQSLSRIQNNQQQQLRMYNRSLSSPELAQQLIDAVQQSSLVKTIRQEERLKYCKSWARSRQANEEVLNCIDNQWVR